MEQSGAGGANGSGQTGTGLPLDNIVKPTALTGLSGIIAIASGLSHGLALQSDGTVWSWGYNYSGQLGIETINDSFTPVRVTGINSVTAIAAGYCHSLAIKSDGTVWSWGYNYRGQLGNGTFNNSPHPCSNYWSEWSKVSIRGRVPQSGLANRNDSD